MKKDYDNHFIRNKFVIPGIFILISVPMFVVNPAVGGFFAIVGIIVLISQEPIED